MALIAASQAEGWLVWWHLPLCFWKGGARGPSRDKFCQNNQFSFWTLPSEIVICVELCHLDKDTDVRNEYSWLILYSFSLFIFDIPLYRIYNILLKTESLEPISYPSGSLRLHTHYAKYIWNRFDMFLGFHVVE